MKRKIYLDDPQLGTLEKKFLNDAVDSSFVSTAGPFVSEFEERFAKFLHAEHAVATQSGTAAIHIALYELGIGQGDEVILPALTFAASVFPIMYVGATPVFVDVDLDTWNLMPDMVEQVLTERTKAIMPVHLYGNPCPMEEIMTIAKKYNLYVIEDATESLGSKYKGQFTGTFGDLGTFSFNGNKVITTGGGGMVVGGNAERLHHIKFLVNQARDASRGYYHTEVGFNYRMTNIEAALGLAQMEQLEGFIEKKQRFNAIYREELTGIPGVRFQETLPGASSLSWLSGILLEHVDDIPALQNILRKKGIPTRRHFVPIVEFPPYRHHPREHFQHSYTIYARGLCLPSSTLNSEENIYAVCQELKIILL